MFGRLFKKKEEAVSQQCIVIHVNMRLQPVYRAELLEDPLQECLSKLSLGEVAGGGTAMNKETREVESCDIEIEVHSFSQDTVEKIKACLEHVGISKGSTLMVPSSTEIPVGTLEGLAVYLNGTDLPASVYEQGDPDHVLEELHRLVDGIGMVYSHWDGPTETAFYLYGRSFDEMKNRIQEFLNTYPLCQKSRVVKIA